MNIKVNGEGITTDKTTISELLKELDIVAGRVAVEVNLKVIKKAEYEGYWLHEGDSVEIVYFVGGGQKDSYQRSAISRQLNKETTEAAINDRQKQQKH